jgi:hypothetical protein
MLKIFIKRLMNIQLIFVTFIGLGLLCPVGTPIFQAQDKFIFEVGVYDCAFQTRSGEYEIKVGLNNSANLDRLRITTDDGRITANFVLLSKVRVRQ